MPQVSSKEFGKIEGKTVELYTLANDSGAKAEIITLGGTLVSLYMPDKNGKFNDIVLGFDNLEQYLKESPYFGANIGRAANRIAGGRFTLEGKEYQLAVNNGPNALHGGEEGFNMKIWDAEGFTSGGSACLKLTYTSPDGEENYPGEMNVEAVYSLTGSNELKIDFKASCDKTTIVNLTHHSYFNLAGHNSGKIYDHSLKIEADQYTPVDENLIPIGELKSVEGTIFDFRKAKRIGEDAEKAAKDYTSGFDHNFVLNNPENQYGLAASVYEPKSGRKMDVYTNQPGLQFYAANFVENLKGKDGAFYNPHCGLCLEPQKFPNAVNTPNFASPVLKPGEVYKHSISYSFSTE
ncbi:aldose epimerase family protein [Sedimentisphaera salicampi]|uniref:Aldose 1-epimerase n=1 Tax=Sedimentisphaera salicampi TaxID=1941349 RepID=A0A1W6LM31_9BACT|nr:aldose epimerase family protein [Sedimentisphaera salicampi]ARN56803.1 Aldose 1-epimerase precursor [Sedimentisphaera salicampi]